VAFQSFIKETVAFQTFAILNKYGRLRLLGQKTLFPVVIALFCSQFLENIESWHESSVPLRKVAEKSWRWQKSRGIPVIYDNLGGISDICR